MSQLWNEIKKSGSNINEFYGRYSNLRNSIIPDNNTIRTYQLSHLKALERYTRKNIPKKLNNFLSSDGQFGKTSNQNIQSGPDKVVQKSIQGILKTIRDMQTSGFMSKKFKNTLKNNEEALNKVKKNIEILNKLIGFIENKVGTIDGNYINQLKNCIENFNSDNIVQVLNNLYSLQGELLEASGANWLQEKIPTNFKVYQTGAVENRGGQLITDLMVIDFSQLNNLDDNIGISYTINKKTYRKSLKEFLLYLDNYSDTKHIVLSDESDQLLQSISVLGVQAKSGKKQLPWNTSSKKTWVKPINNNNKGLNPIYSLERLCQLYGESEWKAEKHILQKANNNTYQKMADYGIAHSLSTILHISQNENQYLLTPKGFQTYSSRILELCSNRGSYPFTFKYKITLKHLQKNENMEVKLNKT